MCAIVCAIRLLLFCILVALPLPAHAQAPAATQPAPVSADELERLVGTLQDDAARAKLVGQLQALIAAQRGAKAEEPSGVPFFGQLSEQLAAFTGEVLAGAAIVVDAPRLLRWVRQQVSDPVSRHGWIEAGMAFLLVFGAAVVAEAIVRWVLARLLPRFPVRHSDARPIRILFALLHLLFDALPILAFAGAAYTAITMTLDILTPTRITLSVLVNAAVEVRLLLCVARAVLLPADGGNVFVPIEAESRHYLYIWVKRFAYAALYGYAIPEAAWWLGVPGALYALMLNIAGFVLALLAVIFLLQNRAPIAGWISGAGDAANGWRRVRRTFGEIWHILVILYIVGIYLIYALRIEGGFVYILRATVLSLVLVVAAQLVVRSIQGLSRRGFAIAPELKARYPTLEHRANRYVPILVLIASAVVYIAAAVIVLQAWDVQAFAWLGSDFGRRIIGRAVLIVAVVAVSLLSWELVASAIERYLQTIEGNGAARRTRLRTLLPLLRTALLCVIFLMAALIILSEIGVNIAPLLAGAGVVGLAIGFGSQALVKDVITGLFILIENQLAVGDVVNLGGGHSGLVEAITVRTIQLRDQGGVVHTLPFSEVTTVQNMSKDYANVVARITIAYGEDIDRVVEILRGVCDELMRDEALRPLIVNPFDYQGVDALDQFSVVLLLLIRTLPLQQWKVGRAFNRLVQIAFQQHGIALRDPSPVVLSGLAQPFAAEEAARGVPERQRA